MSGREVDKESRLRVGMRREVEPDEEELDGLDVAVSAVETVEVGRDGVVGLTIVTVEWCLLDLVKCKGSGS
jgi:hypothetical protein